MEESVNENKWDSFAHVHFSDKYIVRMWKTFSDDEVIEFINLLNQVKLGDEVDESKAVSSGAVSYYTIYLVTDETLTISPGKYFKVADRYYEFDNYDELWDEFIVFNSIK